MSHRIEQQTHPTDSLRNKLAELVVERMRVVEEIQTIEERPKASDVTPNQAQKSICA